MPDKNGWMAEMAEMMKTIIEQNRSVIEMMKLISNRRVFAAPFFKPELKTFFSKTP